MTDDDRITVELIGGPLCGTLFCILKEALQLSVRYPLFAGQGGRWAISFYASDGKEYWYEIDGNFARYRPNVYEIGK